MRAFVVMCLVAVALADKLGYDYQPVGHSDSGLSFIPGSASSPSASIASTSGGILGGGNFGNGVGGNRLGGGGGSLGGNGLGGGNLGGGSLGGGSLGGGSLVGGSLGGGSLGGGNLGGNLGGNGIGSGRQSGGFGDNGASFDASSYNGQAVLEKEFFSFSAPENEFDDSSAAEKIAGNVRQGLRVIFIKGPENKGLENAALALARQAAEQKTAIYVLNKQVDIGDLANKLNAIGRNNKNRPEVHFVKYRTPEDAANAQKAIQSQYDSLGGSSQSHNGGVANVINFASRGPIAAASTNTPNNSYLPSSIFRRRARI